MVSDDDNADESAETSISKEDQDLQLEAAKRAAATGQPVRMLECLHKSRALDGLVRRLQSKWPNLAASDIEMAVAKAVDAAYELLKAGKIVASLVGFLWKAADRRAFDHSRLMHEQVSTDPALIDTIPDPNSVKPGEDTDQAEMKRDEMIRRALQIARKLLPRLGETMRRVMTLVVDAAEQGLEDLPNSHIASVLNLSVDAVKQSKSRGLKRLERLAKEEGLVPDLPMTSLGGTADTDETQDEDES